MDNSRLVLALMRFFATFLITNAHIEGLYPAGWKMQKYRLLFRSVQNQDM